MLVGGTNLKWSVVEVTRSRTAWARNMVEADTFLNTSYLLNDGGFLGPNEFYGVIRWTVRVLRSADVVSKVFPRQRRNLKVGKRSIAIDFKVLVMVFLPYLKVPIPPADGGIWDSRGWKMISQVFRLTALSSHSPRQLRFTDLWSQDHSLTITWSSKVGGNSTAMWPDLK